MWRSLMPNCKSGKKNVAKTDRHSFTHLSDMRLLQNSKLRDLFWAFRDTKFYPNLTKNVENTDNISFIHWWLLVHRSSRNAQLLYGIMLKFSTPNLIKISPKPSNIHFSLANYKPCCTHFHTHNAPSSTLCQEFSYRISLKTRRFFGHWC